MLVVLLSAMLASYGATWRQVGQLTIMSGRNFDRSAPHVLLATGAEGQARVGTGETMQQAIDRAMVATPGGEYMQNVQVWLRSDGEYLKVVGDVWGLPPGSGATGAMPAMPAGDMVRNTPLGDVPIGRAVLVPWKGETVKATIQGGDMRRALVEVQEGTKVKRTSMDWSAVKLQ